MATDLDTLIDFYRWEIHRIKSLIEEHKEMEHYEELLLDNKALQQSCKELDQLLLLKNPNHYKIQENEMMLSSLKRLRESMVKRHKGKFDDSFLVEQIRSCQNEVQRLSKNNINNREETQVIDEALYKIWEEKIKIAKLTIDGHDAMLTLEFSKISNSQLMFQLYFDNASENKRLSKKNILKELQFKWNEEFQFSLKIVISILSFSPAIINISSLLTSYRNK